MSLAGKWTKNLYDTDKVLEYFYDECAAAGMACPLHANTSSMVQQRVENIFASIKSAPLSVIDDSGLHYGIIDYSKVKFTLFMALYSPFVVLPGFADVLAALEKGDGRPALALWQRISPEQKCELHAQLPLVRMESGYAVMCGEGNGAGASVEDIVSHFNELSKMSTFADVWTLITGFPCVYVLNLERETC